MSEIIAVSTPAAYLFYDQCCGVSNGHMAEIPNSPIIKSMAVVHGVSSKKQFADFLREVADCLDED